VRTIGGLQYEPYIFSECIVIYDLEKGISSHWNKLEPRIGFDWNASMDTTTWWIVIILLLILISYVGGPAAIKEFARKW
jgi:hypothetical protein